MNCLWTSYEYLTGENMHKMINENVWLNHRPHSCQSTSETSGASGIPLDIHFSRQWDLHCVGVMDLAETLMGCK